MHDIIAIGQYNAPAPPLGGSFVFFISLHNTYVSVCLSGVLRYQGGQLSSSLSCLYIILYMYVSLSVCLSGIYSDRAVCTCMYVCLSVYMSVSGGGSHFCFGGLKRGNFFTLRYVECSGSVLVALWITYSMH